jgi:hypothetical protein
MSEPIKWNVINVTSGYGFNTRQPFVEVKTDKLKEPLQLSPEEARDLALNLLSAAEASENDAFIFEFHSTLGGERDDKLGAGVLFQFRKWRDDHGQNK